VQLPREIEEIPKAFFATPELRISKDAQTGFVYAEAIVI